jgi:hypothetical protein
VADLLAFLFHCMSCAGLLIGCGSLVFILRLFLYCRLIADLNRFGSYSFWNPVLDVPRVLIVTMIIAILT